MGGGGNMMSRAAVAKAFNQWMDEYTKDPDKFEATHKTAMAFLNDRIEGKEPSYGEECVAILDAYITQQ